MKTRSVSNRNLLGAMFGGMLGILSFGYLHPTLFPIGCLLGVLVGYWYQEIWRTMADTARRTIGGISSAIKAVGHFIEAPTHAIKRVWRWAMQTDFFGLLGILFSVILFIVSIPLLPVRGIMRLVRWTRKHPMNRVLMLRVLISILFVGALGFGMFLAGKAIYTDTQLFTAVEGNEDSAKELGKIGLAFLAMIMVMLTIATPFTVFGRPENPSRKVRYIYRTWKRYDRKGPFVFALLDIKDMIIFFLGMLWVYVAAATWFIGFGLLFLGGIVLPLSLAFGFVKAIYQVSLKHGHWLCFGVTVTVTGLMAWTTHGFFENPYLLWSVALVTGIISAGITEAIRHLLMYTFSKQRALRGTALVPVGKLLKPVFSGFGTATRTMGRTFIPAFFG